MAKKTTKRSASKRERLSPRGDTRYVRRDAKGKFEESDDAGRSLRADRRQKARKTVKAGQGDRGDLARPSRKKSSRS